MPRVVTTAAAKRSRVAHLLEEVPRSLKWVSPDKVQELDQVVDDLCVLAINGRAKPTAHYYPKAKAVGVTSRLIEVLWCQAYGYELLCRRVFAGADAHGQYVRFDNEDDLRVATELVKWAAHQMAGEYAEPWPNHLPTSQVPAPKAECVANQQALIALNFIIHHELAHHRFGHRGKDVEQEKDADAAAADWLLSDHEPSSQVSFARARGVSVALLFLACTVSVREGVLSPAWSPQRAGQLS